jgi:hypothetical protein
MSHSDYTAIGFHTFVSHSAMQHNFFVLCNLQCEQAWIFNGVHSDCNCSALVAAIGRILYTEL